MDRYQLQRAVLETIGTTGVDARLGKGRHYLVEAVKSHVGVQSISAPAMWDAVWSLVAQGLSFIDMTQPAPENWTLRISPAGQSVLDDDQPNPDDASGYLIQVVEAVTGLSPTARRYLQEAVHAYNQNLYLAATVMLGVASEVVFFDIAEAFADSLHGRAQEALRSVLRGKAPYRKKVEEFQKRLAPEKPHLPREVADNLDLLLFGVLDLLRTYRNDAGHATEVSISRQDCFVNLRLAPRYFGRMYQLKAVFGRWKAGAVS